MIRSAAWLLVMAAALAPAAASAAGGASCVLAMTPLVFGAYVPFSNTSSDFTATVTLNCTASGTAAVQFNGTIALVGGSAAGRVLTSGTHQLRYQLYRDPGRTVPWGDGGAGGSAAPVSAVINGSTPLQQTLTVYGRILARQSSAAVGRYNDQITAVLNY